MEQPLVALGLHERLVTTGMQATLDAEAQLRVEIAKVDAAALATFMTPERSPTNSLPG